VLAQNPERTELRDGDALEGRVQPSPVAQLDQWEDRVSDIIDVVEEAGVSLTNAGNGLSEAADKVVGLLNRHENDIDNAFTQVADSMEELRKAAASVNSIFGDEPTQQKLQHALQELPATLDSMNRAMALAETNLENLESFTEMLGSGGTDQVDVVFQTIDRLGYAVDQMAKFGERLNSSDGTLGLLMQDRQLYDHITRAARNVDALIVQLKPIVDDARVFSDKIARHPELLGVRGALQRNPGIK
jgi:phospholipid/cholesterol/gamma-HCH transport system substrate-binding protein